MRSMQSDVCLGFQDFFEYIHDVGDAFCLIGRPEPRALQKHHTYLLVPQS